jgi:hypothetical protein
LLQTGGKIRTESQKRSFSHSCFRGSGTGQVMDNCARTEQIFDSESQTVIGPAFACRNQAKAVAILRERLGDGVSIA